MSPKKSVDDATLAVMPPGVPGSEEPSLAEPVEPREPLPPKPDQAAPAAVSPTGTPTGAPLTARSQAGPYLTTATGVRLADTDHSLKAGPRGPVLLQDHHLREKIMHFDHERIPERAVHARGAAAHGVFVSNGAGAQLSRAGFLAPDVETPVFVRFSTVLGSRGSADTARDTRGFAVKFYTDEGNFDLVGNNIPVFFIQDAIKFPDLIHAGKPDPSREIPQAQSAHDSFWDFVSLHTEATHHVMWNMSDRGLPRSWRTMEGFGVHTFRLVDADGGTTLVKFHWKPRAGVHSLVWEEAQMLAGADPDFHRRDLADAIESGNHPAWDLGVQVFPDIDEEVFEGIDLLDATKMVPEELAPVQLLGTLTLTANPTNYFAETEQVAFHTGHLVPGIDATDDPLLAGRNFSYLDTQLTRLGGPNFGQIPINRPHAPVNDNTRDGYHQQAVHGGPAPYRPNSLGGGNPSPATVAQGAFIDVPAPVAAADRGRVAPASFDDHTSQARVFWLSLAEVEQDHVVAAFTFELAKCWETVVKQRELAVLAEVDPRLCARVAAGLGLPAPEPAAPVADVRPSPALSQLGGTWPVDGRLVGVVVDPAQDLGPAREAVTAVLAAGMLPLVVAPHGGVLDDGAGDPLVVQRVLAATRSVEFDALLVVSVPPPAPDALVSMDGKAGAVSLPEVDPRVALMVAEAYRHCKALSLTTSAVVALEAAGCDPDALGVLVADDVAALVAGLAQSLAGHRAWDRFPVAPR